MLGRRSLNLDLTSLDPEIEKTLRRRLRNSVEMGDNMHADGNERNRGENVDHTRTLRDLFAPVATNSPSCIVLPPTNATYFDLKPHVIQLLPAFHGLDLMAPVGFKHAWFHHFLGEFAKQVLQQILPHVQSQ
jgi:hypothetical protein